MDRESIVESWLRNINEQLILNDRRCHAVADEHALLLELSEDGQDLLFYGELLYVSEPDELFLLRRGMELNARQDIMKRCWLSTDQNKLILVHNANLTDCDEIDFENTLNNFIALMSTIRSQLSSVVEPVNEATISYSQQLIKG
ncbi:CesT family type III secretion system chaperone [Vibrio sagamiensis]|uniref:Uncharacterized protein n=1 Tax=Vibrio sagamiensis NBRC 104589 TaxID=1219064 RepID=A0A511QJY5_9VIBR|nr:CesT family type III secretion system chaperone [Vibrio sagamiensis]PNQ57066.1 hypothetical protein C1141_13630 [Vibrio agarivorans]GEM77638.1 hypothetical protein VSA01S_37500 [Vibrio sagamiensis NBRC 104589]